jgi:hypothetical protein
MKTPEQATGKPCHAKMNGTSLARPPAKEVSAMNPLRVSTLAAALLFGFCTSLQILPEARAETASLGNRVLTGELVITNAARNQFRLVQHNGSFTAPAGISIEALDGKPVQVELGRDGRVLEISQKPIHYEPITHGFEVISGELVVRDAARRTFAIAGDDHTYVAPSGMNIGQYAGRTVEMRVDEQGRVLDMNLIARSGDAPLSLAPRACLIGDANVANGSSICRRGQTFRCADGEWVNTGATCS